MKRLCFLYLLRGHQSGAGLNAEDALMKRLAFRGWLRSVKKLSSAQKKELRNELAQAERKSLEEEVAALVGIPARRLPPLPPWRDQAVGPCLRTLAIPVSGVSADLRTLTKSPLAELRHKDRWRFYMEGMNEGESVRKAAWRCGINREAAFNWRQRFLTLPEAVTARHETGIVEADETYFLESFKG